MVKTEGFHKVVKASADTPQKPQISKLLPPAFSDSHIIRAYKRVRFQRPNHTMNALTSEYQYTKLDLVNYQATLGSVSMQNPGKQAYTTPTSMAKRRQVRICIFSLCKLTISFNFTSCSAITFATNSSLVVLVYRPTSRAQKLAIN